jgi:hypothetical protein
VRGKTDVVCLGHVGNATSFRDTTSVGDVGLDDVDAASLKVWTNILAGEQALSKLLSARQINEQLTAMGIVV